ncbi:hypothetical protein PBAT_07920 [Paenibacillus antarcticus]|uniref:Methyltransferase n=1 Tax=Paenibacillus antarcticus TaxID=253703 RepID=A0A168PYJ4_9BACL|nr:hypothetical protein PBAT_07920 [Paenibacillus antarcticus]
MKERSNFYTNCLVLNMFISAGFVIEQMIEETDNEIIQLHDENNDFVKRAKMFPVTFVIKARKF